MNFYVISGLIAFIINLLIGIFVYTKNPRNSTNKYFALFSLTISGWSMGSFLVNVIQDKQLALFALRCNYSFAVWLPSLFIHFIYNLTGMTKVKHKILSVVYIISCLLTPFVFTSLFIKGLGVLQPWKFYISSPGPVYYVFFIFFVLCTLNAVSEAYLTMRKSSDLRRIQLKYIILSYVIAILAGFEYFSRVFGIFKSPPLDDYILVIYFLVFAYTILRYRLLEIEVVVRKTIVFAGLFTSISAVFIGTAYLSQSYLTPVFGSKYFGMAIAVFIIVLVQEPLKKILIKHTDRFLLQKKYDYQKVLRDASEGMSTVRELKWLLGLMTHIVSSKMRVSNIGIFLQEDELNTEHYFLKAKRGKEPIQPDALSKDNPICLWLKDNKKPLVLEEIDYLLQRKESSAGNHQLKSILLRIKSQMQSLNSKVIIPAYYKGSLLGFLSLGYKLSGDMYTKEDLILLSTLSSSAAIAIENARLFDSLIDEIEINNQLRKEEEDSYIQMMMSLAKTIDAKDSYTYDHVEMVYQYGVDLANYLPGVNKEALKASLRLHDLGKIGVPDSILSKQGPLDAEEWKKIKEHTVLGARILSPLKKFEYVAKIILHHQEKFDGTGYPAGLKGEQIPIESRIISVVDAYHAMISDRPYRKALPKETAIAELKKFSGTQFDPAVVEAFLKLLSDKYGVTTS